MPPPLPIVPRATYRLQLHAGFGFADAQAVVPYLAALGISHLYSSPITTARPGSMHGYDVVDFNQLNPELGGEEDFARLVEALHAHDMGLIVDFVPNHMGVDSGNPWWQDVLEWGESSPYAEFFDIDWQAGALGPEGKILLPVLGDHYGTLLEAGELVLRFDPDIGGIFLTYHDNRFPVAVRHYAGLLLAAAGRLGDQAEPLLGLIDGFTVLAGSGAAQQHREAEALKARLKTMAAEPAVREAVDTALNLLNGTPGLPTSFRMLNRLLDDQAYRLAFWRVASSEINYRRFFDINELAALRMDRSEVFEATHQLLFRLIGEGAVQGIRLDHIDGLHDPFGYCERLRRRALEQLGVGAEDQAGSAGPTPVYIVVEKILAWHERLRAELPVAGTTGYDFMTMVNGLFVDPAAERAMTLTYGRFIGREPDFAETVEQAKLHILRYALDSELHVLAHQLYRLAQQSWSTRDYTVSGLREALAEVIVRFPVYRTYVTAAGATDDDRRYLDWAIGQARKSSGLIDRSVFDFLHAALTTDLRRDRHYWRSDLVATAMRFQQLTSPVMAKAVEDTAFYRYVRLLSLNDVGGDPDHFGVSVGAFHHVMQQQQREHPLGMLATATHDHKRGEDVRARIDALSELAPEWRRRVRRWAGLNRFKLKEVDGRPVPGRNDSYLLYQTLVGAWPLGLDAEDAEGLAAYAERIVTYMMKATREAKQRTSWTAPDEEYESGVERFVRRILDPQDGRAFLADLLPFQAQVALIGAVNGLAQTLLKLTAPGVPDTYQGCELWDLSLVDPDNRRPVDFELRGTMLAQDAEPAELLASWQDGRIKQHVVARTLALRRAAPALFAGDYTPLETTGPQAERLVAFCRSADEATLVTIVPRLVGPLLEGVDLPMPPPAAWADTRIVLPHMPAGGLHDALTGRTIEPGADGLAAADVLADLPVALLTTVRPG